MKSKIIIAFALCFCLLTISSLAQKSKKTIADEFAEKFTDAAEDGNLEAVKLMLANGVNVDIEPRGFKGWTALMGASTFGKTAVVKYLISKGASVKVKLEEGETALIQSAQSDANKEIVEALVKAGIEINAPTKKGLTALMRFAWTGQTEAVKLLLDAGADTKLKDENGWTAFYFACAYGNDEKIVKHLLDAGDNPNEKDAKGQTPLMWTGWGERTETFKALIAAEADVNAKDNDGKTPLMIASSRFFYNEIKILLNAKAEISTKDKNGWNALMFASSSVFRSDEFGSHGDGFVVWLAANKILEELIAAGINVNTQNNDGETALMLAIKAGNAHFAETLLAKGANPNIKNKKGKAANDYADKNYDKRRDFILKLSGRIK